MLCEKLQTNLRTSSPEFMCQFIFVQFKTPSAQVIPTLKRANPPKLRGSRSIIQSIFTTCTTSVTPKTNKHTHTEKLRCLQGNIWSKEEQGGGGEGRSCHLYQVLLESSRFILKPFDLRGLRSDIFKVFFKWQALHSTHCTQCYQMWWSEMYRGTVIIIYIIQRPVPVLETGVLQSERGD